MKSIYYLLLFLSSPHLLLTQKVTPFRRYAEPCIFKNLAGEHDEKTCRIRDTLKKFEKSLQRAQTEGKLFGALNS